MTYIKTILTGILIISVLTACQAASSPIQANAGDDFSVKLGEAPMFDGCASTGAMINYKWTIVRAPETMLEDGGKVIREVDVNCSFILGAQMGVDELGVWIIELEVTDEAGNKATDTVKVTVDDS